LQPLSITLIAAWLRFKKFIKKLTPESKINNLKIKLMINVHFQSVNYKADKKLKDFAKKRIEKLSLFYNQIIEVYVFTKVENNSDGINKWTELKIGIPGDDIVVKKISKSFEESINSAADSAERILKRRKEKERIS
jgi:putative sigma-54 modulation protein